MPSTLETAKRAAALPKRTTPPIPGEGVAPMQARGIRPSRALPYDLHVDDPGGEGPLRLTFGNRGSAAAVFQVYDHLRLGEAPCRFTAEAGKSLDHAWQEGPYDVSVFGPGGFFRRFRGPGKGARPLVGLESSVTGKAPGIALRLQSMGATGKLTARCPVAEWPLRPASADLSAGDSGRTLRWSLGRLGGWYDLVLSHEAEPGWSVHLSGRVETGRPSFSDPAMGGPAVMRWD